MMMGRGIMARSLAARRGLRWVLAVAVVVMAGCKSAPKIGAAELLELGPAAESLRSTAIGSIGQGPGRAAYAAWGEGPEPRMELERDEADADGRYVQRRFIGEGAGRTLSREQRLRVREDGSLVLEEEINHAEGVEVVFRPALEVIPANIVRDEPRTQELRMTVHPLGDRKRVRARGPATQTTTLEGAVLVRTPAGEFAAWKLRSTLSASLSASRVSNETELWIDPGAGIVAERRRERTTVLGLAIRDNREAWVLIDVEGY